MSNESHDYQIIPQPEYLSMQQGRFLLNSATKIIAEESLHNEASYLSDLLEGATGFDVGISKETEEKGNVKLELDASIKNDEGYVLSVSFERIIISGKTAQGIFYGIQSLRQLMPIDIESRQTKIKELTIPAVEIRDSPRFSYRGMHLDVGRHFFPVSDVKKYIDLIAMHKMNTFHWHLTEDQGWRIEIKKYPRLTEIGAYRKGTAIGLAGTRNAPYTYDTIPYGGFYTQEEIKEVVAYAGKQHITIIPEIELPGHSSAALAAYPEFGNTKGPYEVAKRWGIFKEIYAPTEETFAFLEDILTEVIGLFPSKFIHIGGDEALKDEWEKSAYAQEVIKREGLKDEHELQSYFIARIEKFLNANGRDIIGWDEILEGGLAPNATVMSWRGIDGGIAAAKQGHNVIMTPGTHCYFDYYQEAEEKRIEEPITGSVRFTTVEKVYNYEPIPEGLTNEEAKFILGAQGNVWTEYMPTYDIVEYKVLPRMTALSEVVWSSKESRDWESFHSRLQSMVKRYDALGYNYAKYSIISPD
ncbi:beta-N-acetylhexosaminidase [Lutimonas halocynthiae]|uniref:beta-N-acetylhexosaminidase n=1 Tax=Lutimonas halocynthiae TaxID=1446477 RepID=UPI0025B39B3E|nr:beta-N-acetylhexosaminidase [Lutimonas halocynthiae]MDN3641460.1 beta-N-acetylhexosaminidase [Lutimonas halocynthiae]